MDKMTHRIAAIILSLMIILQNISIPVFAVGFVFGNDVSSVYAAISYAAARKISVIDLPLTLANSAVLSRAVSAARANGITVVGAAGDENSYAAGFPAGVTRSADRHNI